MQHYQLPQEKVKHFVVVIGTIFLLTINMCDRGRTITHLQIPRFHTQVWYNSRYFSPKMNCIHYPHIFKIFLDQVHFPRYSATTRRRCFFLWDRFLKLCLVVEEVWRYLTVWFCGALFVESAVSYDSCPCYNEILLMICVALQWRHMNVLTS